MSKTLSIVAVSLNRLFPPPPLHNAIRPQPALSTSSCNKNKTRRTNRWPCARLHPVTLTWFLVSRPLERFWPVHSGHSSRKPACLYLGFSQQVDHTWRLVTCRVSSEVT
ncbi:hypothetical protein RRG08_007028 [Elysia crispata]|uniref:Uncharacterized protein n=1 Tax=Elysia crispata TaxID=231223 RepID=A0AAE1DGW0_9GAST|nr:hypothetical protein RRG08_007028 [Elysia crispata]